MVTESLDGKLEREGKRLILISGGSRGIGANFADYYESQKNTDVKRISRKSGPNLIKLNLYNERNVNNFIENLDLESVRDIVYIHAVGVDKFEMDGNPEIDYDEDGIDDEVYATNVTAFTNLFYSLIEKVKLTGTPTTVCNIGSVGDIYRVPFWQSFTRSKNIVRSHLKSINLENVTNVILNVGSTLDEDLNKFGRKNADTTYWQTSKELLEKSIGCLEGMGDLPCNYSEFDFYKRNPNFRGDYFTNLPKLLATWQKDLGYEGKPIPRGIRI